MSVREQAPESARAVWRRLGTLVFSLGLGACALSPTFGCQAAAPEEPARLGRLSQALTSYTIALPKGAALGQVALLAGGALVIEDRVRVVDLSGAPAGAANSGTTSSGVGVEASLGQLVSVAPVTVKDRAKVHGDLTSSGALWLGVGVVVDGVQHPNQPGLLPGDQETLQVELGGTSLGNISLEPPNTGERVTTLTPGRYGAVVIKSRNRVNLTTGSYVLDSLQVEPGARLVLNDSAGAVLVSVRDSLLFKGLVQAESGLHPAMRLAYLGTQAVVLEAPFSGTVLAPRAAMRLATPPVPAKFVGSFFAKDLTVSADVVVEFRPYVVYSATRDLEVASSTYGTVGYAAYAPDGSANARTPSNVIKLDAAGTHHKLLPTDIEVQYIIDPETGAFGYYGDKSFLRYRPDGSLLGSYPTSRTAKAWFVPGTQKTAILLSDDRDHEPQFSAIRLVGPSLSLDIPAPGLRLFAPAPASLVYTTATELISLTHTGTVSWRIPLALRDLSVAFGGSALIGVRAQNGSSQIVRVNLANGSVTDLASLPTALWSLGIAPAGKYSIAATRIELSLFNDGALVRKQTLPMSYFASADVNDAGEVVVGGADAAGKTVLMVLGGPGTQSWVDATGVKDNIALRPYVRFKPGSADFVAVRKEGLSRYTVKRSL
ncbi:MAG: hypothetical protein ABJB12_11790 [Pseudomonadota bacterium]